MEFTTYKKLVYILKKNCPPAYPVAVRRIKINGLYGNCVLHKKKFYISINKTLDENTSIDTLLHEWAHAIAWSHLHDSMDQNQFEERIHDAFWGVAYSQVYRIYEQYFLKECPQNPNSCGKFKYK